MLNIVFLDRTGIPATHNIPRPSFPHNWIEYDRTSAEETYERAKDADIVITSKVLFGRELLAKLPKLKLIAITATGTNNIDLVAAKELGIAVKNVTGYSSVTAPEHVLGMIFSLKHSLMSYHRDQVTSDRWATCGQFCYVDYPITDVRGSTLGVFGKGCLGTEVGRLAELVGMNVLYAEHKGATTIRDGYTPFEEVLKQADIVTLHCPLTETTQNLINAETLALMKPTAYLINTGRGPLVDEAALLDALENGTIAGAALDVLVKEPPAIDNPLIQAAKRLPNLLITPHVAWASDSAVTTLVNKVAYNIEEFVKTGK
ncbi:2-hydroxyacid dehydrogenase [Glaesserella parasuis]|uniref:2-hydroxyacid dehydrogenase n=1 Tax=Glaesserella parasuis TaxID=738 RepID=A0A7U3NPK7_GLAPU|nr:2-hydroxyacid dehydrogenase [Glaesserella parasuis]EQA06169.1 putative 2-hydroxyacid dehydrogenase [Glaesserella parasuis 12939]AMW17389.1 glycerate dehydrogenase [Glaesserella parasuis]MCT8721046.1 2-hydroxyacid dehydrogenase [Glaesserella parasuis]MCT8727090.1 2-hydroxyacid dehydrogenase [Glaesserella parasuis]MDD2174646.1 2-hydroxyacid dehydrogenase [Glaesserella parasuis]